MSMKTILVPMEYHDDDAVSTGNRAAIGSSV